MGGRKLWAPLIWVVLSFFISLGYTNCAEFGKMESAQQSEKSSFGSLDVDSKVLINSNRAYTTTTAVSLTLKYKGADEVYVTNDAGCASGGVWETLKGSRNWVLPLTNQSVSVFAKFRNSSMSGESACLGDSIIHDSEAPSFLFMLNPPAETSATTVQFEFSSIDAVSGFKEFQCSLENTSNFKVCAAQSSFKLGEGDHKLYVRAYDNAGNYILQMYPFKIDFTAPSVSITSTPAAYTQSREADFEFTGLNGVVRFECSLDNTVFSTCTSPFEYFELDDGSHVFELRGQDRAGNISSIVSRTWMVDRVLPTIRFTNKPEAANRLSQFTFSFLGADTHSGISRVECKLDGGIFSTCGSNTSHAISNIGYGSHQFQIRAIDRAGNVSTAAVATWTRLPEVPSLTSPMQWQVIQRASNNQGAIPVSGSISTEGAKLKITLLNASNVAVKTTEIPRAQLSIVSGFFSTDFMAPAGGWYVLKAEVLNATGVKISEGSVSHVGVGEVFLTAGGSNSIATGQGPITNGTLSSAAHYNYATNTITWRKDIDLPAQSRGSVWAPFVNDLSARLRVPVAIAMVGCNDSGVKWWLPMGLNPPSIAACGINQAGGFYLRLLDASQELKNFRAVLWHQGESDMLMATSTNFYYAPVLKSVIQRYRQDVGRAVPWFVAKASYLPSVDVNSNCVSTGQSSTYAAKMILLRAAQSSLWNDGTAIAGPNTDEWIGPYRRTGDCFHFSSLGQQQVGRDWSTYVKAAFTRYNWAPVYP